MNTFSDFTPVPDRFIDDCMEDATRTQIIVYLYMLRLRASGKKYSADKAAHELHLDAGSVEEALSYWKKKGLLSTDSPAVQNARARLLTRIEGYIGKPLSVQEMQTVYYICDGLHFSDDLTDYLVQYCADQGKRDFRYIEKTAIGWAEAGIMNRRQASLYVSGSGRGKRYSRGESASSNKFNHFKQNNYDFDRLEKEILEGDLLGPGTRRK